MAKNRPLQLNLLALLAALAIVTLVYLTLGQGLWLQIATTLTFTVPVSGQLFLLAASANAHRNPPPYVSTLVTAIWMGAAYPVIGLNAPPGLFPDWFFLAAAPVGFLMCYAMISVFTWMVARI